MTNVNINFMWKVGCDVSVELPEGKITDDIETIEGTGYGGTIYFKDGSELDFDVNAHEIQLGDYLGDEADKITLLAS